MTTIVEMDGSERRRSPRIALQDSYGTINGELHTLANWSREGALIEGYDGDLQVGDTTTVKLEITTPRGFLVVHGSAEVKRRGEDGLGVMWSLEPLENNEDREALVSFFLNAGVKDLVEVC